MSATDVNPSENLIQLIDRLILEKCYDGIPILLQDNRNITHLKDVCSDAVQICVKHLTDENYKNDLELYISCESLLKSIAEHAGQEEILFELLEIIETTRSDNTFTSTLKALQVCLVRLKENKARALEWSLNSIQSYIAGLHYPELLQTGYDEKQENVLEQDENIHRILTNYITIFLFYEPILKELVAIKSTDSFKSTIINRKNVLTCFVLQLLDRPLALLDLSNSEKPTNMHSIHCAKTLTKDLSALLIDPFYLLSYVERRVLWKPKLPEDGVYELASRNIFLIEEKAPLAALGVYYYLLISENLLPENAPKMYRQMYIFEMCLYLTVELFKCEEPTLQYKGLLLTTKTIQNLGSELIDSNSLELEVHSNFCRELTNIVIYSTMEKNRKTGIILFKKYIYQFDDEGKFYLIKNLLQITTHNGLFGYLTIIYKNIIAERLKCGTQKLSEYFSGQEFKNIVINFICKLTNGVETDIMQNSDQIISALNILRYFLLADTKNKTGILDFLNEIDSTFLAPLRKAIELSRAHYHAEEYRVKHNEDNDDDWGGNLDISMISGGNVPEITREHKLKMLSSAMITFDLIESLLARVTECIDGNKHNKFL